MYRTEDTWLSLSTFWYEAWRLASEGSDHDSFVSEVEDFEEMETTGEGHVEGSQWLGRR